MEASVKLQTRCDLDPTRTTQQLYDPLIDKTILLRPMLFVFFSFFLAVFNNNNNNFPRVNANEFVRSYRNRMDCRLEGKGAGGNLSIRVEIEVRPWKDTDFPSIFFVGNRTDYRVR